MAGAQGSAVLPDDGLLGGPAGFVLFGPDAIVCLVLQVLFSPGNVQRREAQKALEAAAKKGGGGGKEPPATGMQPAPA